MLGISSGAAVRALGLGGSGGVAKRLQSAFSRHASTATLVIAEHDNATLSPGSLSAVTAAAELNGEVTLLILGHDAHDVAQQVRSIDSYFNAVGTRFNLRKFAFLGLFQPATLHTAFVTSLQNW